MDFLKNFELKSSNIFKIAVIALLALIVLAFGYSMVKNFSGPMFQKMAPRYDIGADYATGESFAAGAPGISQRNILPPLPTPGTTGSDAEKFEVKDYSVTVESRNAVVTCKVFTDLKTKDYVIFENAQEHDKGCNYTFKVKQKNVAEVLAIVKDLDPKELSENTYTIKQLVEDFTSETSILEKKKKSIDETLENALNAYDEITEVARRARDAESLAKIIDSKVQMIERLTQQRIDINAQLEQLGRAKAEQLDRIDYTYFRVNVYENKYLDGENLRDSWKQAIKEFVANINAVLQDVSIGLVFLLFIAAQYIIYALIVVVIAKYVWRAVRYIWNK